MSDSEKNDSQQASGSNVHVIPEQTRATDEDFFDATMQFAFLTVV
jgi:hypothetical protein